MLYTEAAHSWRTLGKQQCEGTALASRCLQTQRQSYTEKVPWKAVRLLSHRGCPKEEHLSSRSLLKKTPATRWQGCLGGDGNKLATTGIKQTYILKTQREAQGKGRNHQLQSVKDLGANVCFICLAARNRAQHCFDSIEIAWL